MFHFAKNGEIQMNSVVKHEDDCTEDFSDDVEDQIHRINKPDPRSFLQRRKAESYTKRTRIRKKNL